MDNKQYNRIITQLKLERKKRNISQKNMAKSLNVSNATYSRIESCKIPLDVNRLIAVCEILKIDLSELMFPYQSISSKTKFTKGIQNEEFNDVVSSLINLANQQLKRNKAILKLIKELE